MIQVVNRNTYAGPGISIMRPSLLGNPYVLGKDGDRATVIEKYRLYLWDCIRNGSDVGREFDKLVKRYLAGESLILICCCDPEACHGHVLARAIVWKASQAS